MPDEQILEAAGLTPRSVLRCRVNLLLCACAAVMAFTASSCGSGDSSTATRDEDRGEALALAAVSPKQLELMPLELPEFGSEFSNLEVDEDETGFVDGEEKAADDFDSEDESKDLTLFRWATSYKRSYSNPGAYETLFSGAGRHRAEFVPLAAASVVDLFDTPEGASGYLDDFEGELTDLAGTTLEEGITVGSAETFQVNVGSKAIGFDLFLNLEFDTEKNSKSSSLQISGVAFQRGRLQGSALISAIGQRPTGDDIERYMAGLAKALDERILGVLRGEVSAKGTATRSPAASPVPSPGPPARGKIAISAGHNGYGQIYVMNADGSDQTLVGGDIPGLAVCPAWSPDGLKLAVSSSRFDMPSRIYVITMEELSVVDLLVGTDVPGRCPVWSPDGSRLAFVSPRENAFGAYASDIYVINADGSGLTQLTNDDHIEDHVSWSPDGERLVFEWQGETPDGSYGSDVYVVNADGSGLTNLGDNHEEETGPVWSADGESIAFVVWNSSNEGLYVMKADGSGRTNLTEGSDLYIPPQAVAWSPDAKRLAFAVDFPESGLYTVDANGSNLRKLADQAYPDEAHPVWSPDGQYLAFVGFGSSGVQEVYVIGANGAGLQRLTSGGASEPSWAPAP